MARALRPVGHEDRLSLVEHLDELRTRLVVSAVALAVALGVCLWQNSALLDIVNRPLENVTQKAAAKGRGPLGQTAVTQNALREVAAAERTILDALKAPGSRVTPATRRQLQTAEARLAAAVAKLPAKSPKVRPITIGVSEPFSTTITVAFYFAILLALPILLWQLYAFLLPAFSTRERKVALPLMLMVPGLFAAGVTFGYVVVLPPALRFLQNFNSDTFDVLVQASAYYRFVALTLLALGLVFQVPVGILAATRLGIVSPRQLRKNRRYAILACAVIAMVLPGTDPVSMLLEMIPLVVLYELSILLSSVLGRPSATATAERDLSSDAV
ncbi:MAG: sec-independent protein translocase protein TatC [Solirubrobacteraceae bacterium]|nr:sec-independent protein translocase protein TatC [Solirubrobacteraceae bacterium]